MAPRDDLIAAKAEVQARIRSLQPKVEAARASAENAHGLRRTYYTSRLTSLQAQLDELTSQEARLRLEIDRAPR